MSSAKSITPNELAAQRKWLAVDGFVYNISEFAANHPGGSKIILNMGGKDASTEFHKFHSENVLKVWGPKLIVGKLESSSAPPSSPSSPSKPSSPSPSKSKSLPNSRFYGEMVPFGDPPCYQGLYSPFYNESHWRFRDAIRKFCDEEVTPFCHEWEEAKDVPVAVRKRFAEVGLLAGAVGRPWPVEYVGGNIAGGVKPQEFDAFHELIGGWEMARKGSAGVGWAVSAGLAIGIGPVMHYGTDEMKAKVVAPCLRGDKVICLAITEPEAGSDVAGLQTTAKLSPDGKHYIVNGTKKWITNGDWADFFTTAVRTGEEPHGHLGVSLLLIERGPGVKTRRIPTMGAWASGSTLVSFEDVKVPVENIIGQEGIGFMYIMVNFIKERWGSASAATHVARVCLHESMKYAFKRKTFGKFLIEHPVIRLKLAHMARQVESCWSQLENITYQMNIMPKKDQDRTLGGHVALLKAHAGIVLEYCAREAMQIFGGLAYTRGGQGEKVERIYRETLAYRIPAGSEEIMLDYGIREAVKPFIKANKFKISHL